LGGVVGEEKTNLKLFAQRGDSTKGGGEGVESNINFGGKTKEETKGRDGRT